MFSRGLKGNTEQKWVKAELRKTLLINGSNRFGQLLTNLQIFSFHYSSATGVTKCFYLKKKRK